MKKFLLVCFSLVFLAGTTVFAQDRVISGKVTSADDGSSLPGVNVVLKGTTNGAVTDADGNYKISVPGSGGTLVFSFIGFAATEVEIGDRTTIDLQMEQDITQLSEVVVTALGIERSKNELTYAAQSIDGSALSQTRDNNFVNSISGKVSGVEIKRNNNMGGSTNIVIRGYKSLTGNNQALFVVDGVPIDNSNTNGGNQQTGRGGYDFGNAAADINADDIASMTVLKGAAATALYGSRGANGVVMITTKKGSKAKGIGITINAGMNFGQIDKTTFPKYQKKYGGGYGAFYEDPTGFFLYRDINGDGTDDLVVPTSEDASWGAPFNANQMVYQWDAFDPSSPNYGKPRPWVAAANDPSTFFETAKASNINVTVDGTSDKGFFKLGYTNSNENGILPNSELEKNFVNFSSSFKLTDKLTITSSANLTKINGLGRYGTGYDDKNLMTSFRQWYQINVDIKEQEAAYLRTRKNVTWNWTDPTDLSAIYWDNPYFTRYENYGNDERVRTYGYLMLNYKIADWLDVMGRASMDHYNEFQEGRQAKTSTTTSNYNRFDRAYTEYNYDLMVNFNKNLTDDLNLKGVVGTNIRRTKVESIFAQTNGGLVVPRLYSLSNSVNPINAPTEFYSHLGINGTFADVTLGYKNMLFLGGSVRRDEASSLPAENNVYYYPSASLGFVFAELLKTSAPWMTNGKLRLNYAEVGNAANPNSTKDVYDKPAPFGSVPYFSIPGTKNNSSLLPEQVNSYEVGLEMGFFENRVGFDVSYYHTSTINQIMPIAISRATGYNSKFINAGEVENKGIELSLNGTPVKTGDLTWSININWTRNRNKVISLTEGIDNLTLGTFQGGVSFNARVGQPFGDIQGKDFVYTNGEKTVNTSGYYLSSVESNKTIGNIMPDWLAGINNSLKYKNVALSFLIDMKQGGQLFNLDLYYGLATGMYEETAGLNDLGNPVRSSLAEGGGIVLPGVKADGTPNDIRYDATDFGIYGYRRNPAAAFVYDASYVKLREVTLSYSLPTSVVSKLGPLNGVDLSIVGRNLWIISKNLPHGDPEDGFSSGNLANGYQSGTYPNVKNLGFNIRFKF